MNNSINKIYEFHHSNNRQSDFSILEKERGELLRDVIGSNKTVLDLGCRDGALTKYFVDGNKVTGVDVDRNSLLKIKNNLSLETMEVDLNADWRELENKKFDVIVAGEILEHLYFPDIVIKKVYNHLQPNGIFLGSIPNAFSFKNRIRYILGSKKILHYQILRILISLLMKK